MKFTGASSFASPEALAAMQRRIAGHHSVRLWPQETYESLYSATRWPGVTVHKIRDPDLVKGVLLDHADCFEKTSPTIRLLQPALGEGLITSEGEAWRRQRAIMTPAFKRHAFMPLTPAINTAASAAMDTLASAYPHAIDVLPVMSRITFEVIRCLSFGHLGGHGMPYDETVSAIRACLDGMTANDPSILNTASETLRTMATAAINGRRPADAGAMDLLSILRAVARPDRGQSDRDNSDPDAICISETELRDNILTAILAGHETTAVTAGWALYLLSRHSDTQEALAQDIRREFPTGQFPSDVERLPRLRRVILEALRLFPPVPAIARVALKAVTISAVEFNRGDIADILVYPMHRNRLLWRDPDTFDPDRFNDDETRARSKFAYIPFGAGPRICIGSQLTHLEVSIVLATILRDCIVLPVDGYEPEPQVRVTLQPHDGLPLYFEPCPSAS